MEEDKTEKKAKAPIGRPEVTSGKAEKELDRLEEQFDKFDQGIKEMTMDRLQAHPRSEHEQQTKLSNRQVLEAPDIYLKPARTISSREKFNEKYREQYEFAKEYVKFIAENREIKGERIDMWTKPFAGMPAEYWEVPVNKPIWGPRYLAEQIKRCYYHRLKMQDTSTNLVANDGMGQYYGAIAIDTTEQRLDAIPASERKSIFMGASSFK